MLRILVAHPRATVRRELRQALAAAVERPWLREAHDFAALQLNLRSQPWDGLVLDLALPGLQGLAVFEALKREHPNLPVLATGEANDPLLAMSALRAGAAGYLCRADFAAELPGALRTILAGGVYISHDLAVWPNPFLANN